MRSKVTLPWNAAAWRQSTYEPRVRKVHGPVGKDHEAFNRHARDEACRFCGHHVCSCERHWPETGMVQPALQKYAPLPPPEGKLAVFTKPEPREYNTIVPPNPGPAGPASVSISIGSRDLPCGVDDNYFFKVSREQLGKQITATPEQWKALLGK